MHSVELKVVRQLFSYNCFVHLGFSLINNSVLIAKAWAKVEWSKALGSKFRYHHNYRATIVKVSSNFTIEDMTQYFFECFSSLFSPSPFSLPSKNSETSQKSQFTQFSQFFLYFWWAETFEASKTISGFDSHFLKK